MYHIKQMVQSGKSSKQPLHQLAAPAFVFKPDAEEHIVNLYPEIRYQRIIGFGSALTDAAACNYANMREQTRQAFIRAFFDPAQGLGYTLCRLHINSCDFSAQEYTYTADGDMSLDSFSVAHDEQAIIPMTLAAQRCAGEELQLFASPWSPPAWMKTNGSMIQGGKLKPDFAACWAEYIVKYVQAYRRRGVRLTGLTVQNESMAVQTWESCVYTAAEQLAFVREHLRPALDRAGLQDVGILIWDHNKERVVDWTQALCADAAARRAVAGVAFHWYTGRHFDALRIAHELAPEQLLVHSECCCAGIDGTAYSGWQQAERYAADIIGNLNNYMNGWTDWNILLDRDGKPYHNRRGACTAPMVYEPQDDTVHTTPIYYAIAHFSKFIKPGAVRIGATSYEERLGVTAVCNPDGTLAVVMQNPTARRMPVTLRIGEQAAQLLLPAHTIRTLVIGSEQA